MTPEEQFELDLASKSCPLCDGYLPVVNYRWYCTACDALVNNPNRKTVKGGLHRTRYGFCSPPMLFVKVAISCSHQFVSKDRDMTLLNSFNEPVPSDKELFPDKAAIMRKYRKKKREQREADYEAKKRQRIIDAGLTPTDPNKFKIEPNE